MSGCPPCARAVGVGVVAGLKVAESAVWAATVERPRQPLSAGRPRSSGSGSDTLALRTLRCRGGRSRPRRELLARAARALRADRRRRDRPEGRGVVTASCTFGRLTNSVDTSRACALRRNDAGASCSLSAGVKDPKAIGFRRISINDLDWRPSPLPNADAWRAGELDLPAGAFDCNARPGFGGALPVRAVERSTSARTATVS